MVGGQQNPEGDARTEKERTGLAADPRFGAQKSPSLPALGSPERIMPAAGFLPE